MSLPLTDDEDDDIFYDFTDEELEEMELNDFLKMAADFYRQVRAEGLKLKDGYVIYGSIEHALNLELHHLASDNVVTYMIPFIQESIDEVPPAVKQMTERMEKRIKEMDKPVEIDKVKNKVTLH